MKNSVGKAKQTMYFAQAFERACTAAIRSDIKWRPSGGP